jgi:hypothetical protein
MWSDVEPDEGGNWGVKQQLRVEHVYDDAGDGWVWRGGGEWRMLCGVCTVCTRSMYAELYDWANNGSIMIMTPDQSRSRAKQADQEASSAPEPRSKPGPALPRRRIAKGQPST